MTRGMLARMLEENVDRRETVAHMIGEFLREVAALILVFVPLDYLLKGEKPILYFWYETIGVRVASILLLAIGILVERREAE